jgi:hypothetical protein
MRYRVWVRDRPSLLAEADFFEAADRALSDVICGATGDGESVREYAPPRPHEERPGLLDRLVAISGERRGVIQNPAELFSDGYCAQCKNARGERTAVALRLARFEPGGNAGYATIKPAGFEGPMVHLYSEAFVARLPPSERMQFEWRTVQPAPGSKERFLEPIAARAYLPFVSLSDLAATLWNKPDLTGDASTWWRCDTCGRTQQPVYAYRMTGLPPYYVSRASLPDPPHQCMGVGDPEAPRVCFTRERWAELVNLPEARGLVSTDVGVVAASLVEPLPRTRALAEPPNGV